MSVKILLSSSHNLKFKSHILRYFSMRIIHIAVIPILFLLSPPLFRAEHKIAGDGLSSVLADEVLAEHLYAVGRGRLRDENDGESFPVSTPTVLFVGWKFPVVLAE